jgi:hypothetical protein
MTRPDGAATPIGPVAPNALVPLHWVKPRQETAGRRG